MVLTRFSEFIDHIYEFFFKKGYIYQELESENWLTNLSFLVSVDQKINKINIYNLERKVNDWEKELWAVLKN